MKQHEEYQVFRIYGILCVKIYVSTSRKSIACFIRDESELTEKFIKRKRKTQTGIYNGDLELIYCI
jgi:hypothetical protein